MIKMTNLTLSALATNHTWMSMSWEVRGMCINIMALGDFELSKGTVSSDEDIWRAQLGFPTGRGLAAQGRRITADVAGLNHAWDNQWAPELRRWFVVITSEFVKKNPKYKGLEGRCWHPLLDLWAESEKNEKSCHQTKRKSKISVTTNCPDFDYNPIRLSASDIDRLWDEPLTKEARITLWDSAVKLFSGTMKETQARAFLGKLIKTYGEQDVAAAVGQIIVRNVLPADPRSFLTDILNKGKHGSIAENKARRQKSRVAL